MAAVMCIDVEHDGVDLPASVEIASPAGKAVDGDVVVAGVNKGAAQVSELRAGEGLLCPETASSCGKHCMAFTIVVKEDRVELDGLACKRGVVEGERGLNGGSRHTSSPHLVRQALRDACLWVQNPKRMTTQLAGVSGCTGVKVGPSSSRAWSESSAVELRKGP